MLSWRRQATEVSRDVATALSNSPPACGGPPYRGTGTETRNEKALRIGACSEVSCSHHLADALQAGCATGKCLLRSASAFCSRANTIFHHARWIRLLSSKGHFPADNGSRTPYSPSGRPEKSANRIRNHTGTAQSVSVPPSYDHCNTRLETGSF